GNRDKSWGPRRWGGTKMWRWFSINISDDVHFGGIRIGTDAGDLHRGWVWRDGEATSIREWDVRTELADDGLTHRVSHVRATDKRDRAHELRADVLRVFGIPQQRRGGTATGRAASWVLWPASRSVRAGRCRRSLPSSDPIQRAAARRTAEGRYRRTARRRVGSSGRRQASRRTRPRSHAGRRRS